ncbi:magnesium transporter, putative [Hepatocystis sp. ex Piliocolobus tephrosceles]|nr:magnesium transporter, putative [Hepatocystis sp. ex Piliocolobus tephrosceles]
MFRWNIINQCRNKTICLNFQKSTNYWPIRWLSNYNRIKNENKIFSKKNFNNVLMQNIRITGDGEVICEKVLFSKYNLPYTLKIPVSDLRLIDTYNNNHNPTLLVRKNVILLRTGFISCIIRYNEIWLFDFDNPSVIKATDLIQENLKRKKEKNFINQKWDSDVNYSTSANSIIYKQNDKNNDKNYNVNKVTNIPSSCNNNNLKKKESVEDEEVVKVITKNNNEKDELNYLDVKNNFYKYKTNIYFEFLCLDICMQLSITAYESSIEETDLKVREIILLQRKEESNELNILTKKVLIDMMKIKNNLQKLANLLNSLRSNIERTLKDQNDMKNMYLTFLNTYKISELKDSSDLEILLETHLQLTDELYGELETVEERITHYEELMRLNLDYNRNKLILLNAKIAFATLLLSTSSIVTGLFGMNLKNFFEDSNYAFLSISVFVALWSIFGLYVTKNINTLLKFLDRYSGK